MTTPAPTSDTELPEAASRRFGDNLFSSSLSIGELAALDQLGLEPVEVVQGFSVMRLAYMSQLGINGVMIGAGWSEQFNCPHGMMTSNEHRFWGANYEQAAFESGWLQGFNHAHDRLVDEAKACGAHAVIGVVDRIGYREELSALEFHLQGTAVRLAGAAPSKNPPFTTSLAGPRLVKLLSAGLAPVRVVAAFAAVHVHAVCVTQYLMNSGRLGLLSTPVEPGSEIVQWSHAQLAVRRLARQQLRSQLGSDELHGVSMECDESQGAEGDGELRCTVRGNRVRRVAAFWAQEPPTPIVTLS